VANARSTKRDIDRVKKERAALKRERRQQSHGESHDSTVDEPWRASPAAPMSEADVLEALNLLHVRFDAGELIFDEFEASKTELFHRLVDR
jgi:hypothetical protein